MATRTISAAGGNYNAPGTWDEGVVPTASDDVVARGDGTSGPLTITAAAACRSANFTNYTGTLTHNAFAWSIGTSTVNGTTALKFVPGMTYTPPAGSSIVFVSSSATQVGITWAGKQPVLVNFQNASGSWLMLDALTSQTGVTMTSGTLDAGTFAHSWFRLIISGASAKTVKLNASTIALASPSPITNTGSNLTVSANTAVATCTAAGTTTLTLGDANYNGMTLVCTTSGAVNFATNGGRLGGLQIVSAAAAAARNVTLASGQTYTVDTVPLLAGNPTGKLTLKASTAGTRATISSPSGVVDIENANIIDIAATGGATFNAKRSVNQGNNTGINFVAAFTGPRWGTPIA